MGLHKIQVSQIYDLGDSLYKEEVIATVSLSPSGVLSVLTVDSPEYFHRGNEVHSKETNYRALFLKENNIHTTEIKNDKWNYHFVQSINDNEFLLACGRSNYYGSDKYDLNARVFSYNGILQREFLLGDGIQDLKVTTDGVIWTSYFDEGVFGNNGWNKPIGNSGLRAWNIYGNPIYSYEAPTSEDFIIDCYAMNVLSSRNVWFYYYDSFKLGQINNNKVNLWETDISGANGIVIFENYILFRGIYRKPDIYSLCQIKHGSLSKILDIEFVDEEGEELHTNLIDYRGNTIILCKGTKIYKFVLDKDILQSLGWSL